MTVMFPPKPPAPQLVPFSVMQSGSPAIDAAAVALNGGDGTPRG